MEETYCMVHKWLLPFRARLLFYKSLVMPLFEYADLVWYSGMLLFIMVSLGWQKSLLRWGDMEQVN